MVSSVHRCVVRWMVITVHIVARNCVQGDHDDHSMRTVCRLQDVIICSHMIPQPRVLGYWTSKRRARVPRAAASEAIPAIIRRAAA